MLKAIIEEKKAYRRLMARVAMLPMDYQAIFRKVQGYLRQLAALDSEEMMKVQREILNEFEDGVIYGKNPIDITGWDLVTFSNAFLRNARVDIDIGKVA